MSALMPQDRTNRASDSEATTSGKAAHQPLSQASKPPDWRSPTANVADNPNRNPQYPKKYQISQTVWVYRAGEGWIEATVVAFKNFNGSWHYWLRDKKGNELWRDQPTWFHETQVHRDEGDEDDE